MKAWPSPVLLLSLPVSETSRMLSALSHGAQALAGQPRPQAAVHSRPLPCPSPVEATLVRLSFRQSVLGAAPAASPGQRKWLSDIQAVLSLLQEVETASNQLKELQWALDQLTPGVHSRCATLVLMGTQLSGTAMATHPSPGAGQVHSWQKQWNCCRSMTCWRPRSLPMEPM